MTVTNPTPQLTGALLLLALAFGAATLAAAALADTPAPAPPATQPAIPARIAAFANRLRNIELVGQFTVGDNVEPSGKERYEITSARWLGGESWIIFARVQYGQRDVTLPVPVQVRFAGDTPVVCLDETQLPLLGRYSARVIFEGDRYAGTWSGGRSGGHLWGIIRPIPTTQPAATQPAASARPVASPAE